MVPSGKAAAAAQVPRYGTKWKNPLPAAAVVLTLMTPVLASTAKLATLAVDADHRLPIERKAEA